MQGQRSGMSACGAVLYFTTTSQDSKNNEKAYTSPGIRFHTHINTYRRCARLHIACPIIAVLSFQCFFDLDRQHSDRLIVRSIQIRIRDCSTNMTTSPFLSSVTDTASFDTQIQSYISGAFAQQRYNQSDSLHCSALTDRTYIDINN